MIFNSSKLSSDENMFLTIIIEIDSNESILMRIVQNISKSF